MASIPKIGTYLDDEEKDIAETLEHSTAPFVSHLTPERRTEIEAMARATMSDELTKISLRISRTDLARLKSRAMQEGIPYETLISSIIHKYVTN
jgi:predicted DNA binding CopG/RHH family protein